MERPCDHLHDSGYPQGEAWPTREPYRQILEYFLQGLETILLSNITLLPPDHIGFNTRRNSPIYAPGHHRGTGGEDTGIEG